MGQHPSNPIRPNHIPAPAVLLLPLPQGQDLLQQEKQIGTRKTHLRRWNTMMLDIGRQMFMMRICGCQFGIIGVRKVIVPEKPFISAINLVSVGSNNPRFEIQFFPDALSYASREENFTFGRACIGTIGPKRNRRPLHLWAIKNLRDKAAVCLQRLEGAVLHG